jgi:3-oxoacyl-[acyl-carrier-protein] synthase II
MCNAPAAHVAMRHGATGPVLTYSVACASSAVAIGEAARAVARGEVDVAFAGGAEALLHPGMLKAWAAMQTLAPPDAGEPAFSSRPFSADRAGMVLGEGAAVLVLEPLDDALERGARIYAELAGYATGCDATHLTRPDADGQARVICAALHDAAVHPAEIGYCNAHGTGTRAGDPAEAAALRAVWGADLHRLRVGATKSMHGHLLGAAGALEAVVTSLAIHRRQMPAHACRGQAVVPDPECSLPLLGDRGLEAPGLRVAISNSFAFGGTNATLVFRRPAEMSAPSSRCSLPPRGAQPVWERPGAG